MKAARHALQASMLAWHACLWLPTALGWQASLGRLDTPANRSCSCSNAACTPHPFIHPPTHTPFPPDADYPFVNTDSFFYRQRAELLE